MYQLYGAAAFARWFFYLAVGIALLVMGGGLLLGRPTPSDALRIGWWVWTSLGTGASIAALLLFGIGSSCIFPWLCRHTWLSSVFPDIDGAWTGKLESNWPMVSAALPRAPAPEPLQSVPVNLRVKARLLSIAITLDSETNYSDSVTVLVGISKNGGDVPCLTYVYVNRTPRQLPTDSGIHQGAARLELRLERGVPTLRGNYWTDRNWERGLNTAGTASFTKIK